MIILRNIITLNLFLNVYFLFFFFIFFFSFLKKFKNKVLEEKGIDFAYKNGKKIVAEDIVDGHREKSLTFLWKIVSYLDTPLPIQRDLLVDEIVTLKKELERKKLFQIYEKTITEVRLIHYNISI